MSAVSSDSSQSVVTLKFGMKAARSGLPSVVPIAERSVSRWRVASVRKSVSALRISSGTSRRSTREWRYQPSRSTVNSLSQT